MNKTPLLEETLTSSEPLLPCLEKIIRYFPVYYPKNRSRKVNTLVTTVSALYIAYHMINLMWFSSEVSSVLDLTSQIFAIALSAVPHIISFIRLFYFVKYFDLKSLRKSVNYRKKIQKSMRKFIGFMAITLVSYSILIFAFGACVIIVFFGYVCNYIA